MCFTHLGRRFHFTLYFEIIHDICMEQISESQSCGKIKDRLKFVEHRASSFVRIKIDLPVLIIAHA